MREAEAARREKARQDEIASLCAKLAALSMEDRSLAAEAGWDGLRAIFSDTLGDDVWERAVNLVPDDWEEEEALDAFERMLAAPEESEYVWLLLSPGRYSTTPLRRP